MGKNICRLCPHFILSSSVTFAGGTLTVNLPAGPYNAGEKYCIVIAQSIPEETTILAPVVVTIGAGTEEYPVINRHGAQVAAASIRTRTKYATCVKTTATGGSFKMLGDPACALETTLTSIDGTAPTEGGTA